VDSDELPTYEDLSREQDAIYNLPLNGNYLVSGPPGTGKSVMALYRAEALTIDDRTPAILMYNQVLRQYTQRHSARLNLTDRVKTFHGWMRDLWQTYYAAPPPKLGDDTWAYDWQAILIQFLSQPPPPGSLVDLLVDEGQDLAPAFYGLARWLCANMTVFADENQQLFEHNSTLDEIARNIKAVDHLRLRHNYRNSAEIAALAAHFYCGSPTGLPESPTRSWKPGPKVRATPSPNDLVDWIVGYVRAQGHRRIGIACKTTAVQKKLFNRLSARKIDVEAYISSEPDHRTLDFGRRSVKIVNYQSLKGLQFDTLFVPELQLEARDVTSAVVRMCYYVVFSRARDELYLSYSETVEPPLVASIPFEILERA
jgi:DNA helicase IV